MKYEIPTCEIVLLERADCLTASINVDNDNDAHVTNYPPTY